MISGDGERQLADGGSRNWATGKLQSHHALPTDRLLATGPVTSMR